MLPGMSGWWRTQTTDNSSTGASPDQKAAGSGLDVESHGLSRGLTFAVAHPERHQHHDDSNQCHNTCRGFGFRQQHQDATNKQDCASADHPNRRRFVCSSPCLVRSQRSPCSETHDPLAAWSSRPPEHTQDDEGRASNHHCDACHCHRAIVETTPPISAQWAASVCGLGVSHPLLVDLDVRGFFALPDANRLRI